MRYKVFTTVLALLAAGVMAYCQSGLFRVAGVRITQDAEKALSLKRSDFGGVGVYVGVGRNVNLLPWLSVSPLATISLTRAVDYDYVPESKISALADIQVLAPVNLKASLKREGRFFYFGAGPSATLTILDPRDEVKHFFGGVCFQLGADVSDEFYFGTIVNFGLSGRAKYYDAYTSSVSIGLRWKFL